MGHALEADLPVVLEDVIQDPPGLNCPAGAGPLLADVSGGHLPWAAQWVTFEFGGLIWWFNLHFWVNEGLTDTVNVTGETLVLNKNFTTNKQGFMQH